MCQAFESERSFVISVERSFFEKVHEGCPLCKSPLEEIYYGNNDIKKARYTCGSKESAFWPLNPTTQAERCREITDEKEEWREVLGR